MRGAGDENPCVSRLEAGRKGGEMRDEWNREEHEDHEGEKAIGSWLSEHHRGWRQRVAQHGIPIPSP
ncbi:hypothetical protein SE18_11925 [Herpetosiphon geysericola]|uniref:Uncharacterized protein n=1 Tax=Herpetosiphon geysericola TaxID=70996 RepID=A0A0P6XTN8_9CHLR|nr:hypothetical protein SE18_11925 [Herpetosiphon geysericola]